MVDKELRMAHRALGRLKLVPKSPRTFGQYGFYSDSMELLAEDIRTIERALSAHEKEDGNATSTIKRCPICGEMPTLIEVDLDRGNGHGWPGEYSYHYECEHCKLVKSGGGDTIYLQGDDKKGSAKAVAVNSWAEKVKKIESYLEKPKEDNE